jgi:MarR family transcriptional regulator, organic hydroperoxide resistance regulator
VTNTITREELLVAGSDEVFRQTLHDALGFASRLQDVRNQLADSIGLAGPAYSILITLEYLSRDDRIGVSAISSHLHLSGAFVTIEVNKLVRAGLVEKNDDPEDGRRVVLQVTDAGHALLAGLLPLQQSVNDTIFADLDHEEFRALGRCMSKLVDGAEDALILLRLKTGQSRRTQSIRKKAGST